MNLVDLFKKGLKCYLRQEYTFHNNLDKKFNIVDVKAIFVADVFDITTYDYDLSMKFGKDIIEVMEVINNRKNFEYMEEDEENYKKFILVANLLDKFNWIEWGHLLEDVGLINGVTHILKVIVMIWKRK